VTGSPRLLTVDAINATVNLDGSPDRVRLKTAEGSITMRGGSRDAGFSTVSGRVHVSGGVLERAHFDATTGDITFAGDLAPAGLITIDSHSGAVDLWLDSRASARIEATTGAGMIENLATKARPTIGREGRGQEIRTEVGTGSAHVVIRTYKGTVRLARR
jgi:DUF4097 and DUF4098 domain-containing protein YvlB